MTNLQLSVLSKCTGLLTRNLQNSNFLLQKGQFRGGEDGHNGDEGEGAKNKHAITRSRNKN